ncbi:MAG: BF3164 family lipoprotein [Acidobacteriota bacterium]
MLLSFIIILFTLISCRNQSIEIRVIHVKEENFAIGIQNDENYMFHEPKDIEIQDDKYIFIADTKNKRVQKFNHNGEFLKSIVKGGEGPDQVLEPVDIELTDKNIFIADPSKRKILFFNKNEEYVSSINTPYSVKNINYFQNYLYILKFSSFAAVSLQLKGSTEGYLGHRVNLLNNQVDLNFCEYLKPLNLSFFSLLNYSSMDMDKNGNIWVAYLFLNKIIKFNKDGKKIKELKSIFTEKKIKPTNLKDLNPIPILINKRIRVDEKGDIYILASISRETEKFQASKIIFKYDNEGNYLGEMYFPYFIEEFNISNNTIYIIDEDFIVRKFKIET